MDLSQFKSRFAGGRFNRGTPFDDFFARSVVECAYQEITGAMAEE